MEALEAEMEDGDKLDDAELIEDGVKRSAYKLAVSDVWA